jgi:hypothetical protein
MCGNFVKRWRGEEEMEEEEDPRQKKEEGGFLTMRSTTASREDCTLCDMREKVSAGITAERTMWFSDAIALENNFLAWISLLGLFSPPSLREAGGCIARAWLDRTVRKLGMKWIMRENRDDGEDDGQWWRMCCLAEAAAAQRDFEKSTDRDKVCEGILCPAAWKYRAKITCNLLGDEPMHGHSENLAVETSVCIELHPLLQEHLRPAVRFKPVKKRQVPWLVSGWSEPF